MGDETAEPDDVVDEAVRGQLATQMARLNTNLERQFALIEKQQGDERNASRRRWRIVMGVVLLIGLGNVRVEMVRREGDRRDKASAAAAAERAAADEQAQELAQCRRTNLSRAEIRGAFDQQGEALLTLAGPDQLQNAASLVQDTHDRLAATLKSTPCSSEPPATYDSCAEAVADGQAPLRRGQPGYRRELDADGDGVACE